jgi:hypothetical protein
VADYLDKLAGRGVISASRMDILRQGLDRLKESLMPDYLRDTPSSPQADRALADPNGKPRKIGPPSGPATTLEKMGGFASDAAASLAPELKGAAVMKGIFAGPMAKTADLAALARAQKMAEVGHHASDIWENTGWFQGADKKWRFEIPDEKSQWVRAPAKDSTDRMSDVLSHSEAYQNYPELADIWAEPIRRGGSLRGEYYPPGAKYPRDVIRVQNEPQQLNPAFLKLLGVKEPAAAIVPFDPRSTALHELQHAIQEREGFQSGGNSRQLGEDRYRRTAGEVEARNVEARKDMTPSQRRAKPPWTTEDVPRSRQEK